jgi:hypothetical protein
MIHVFMAFFKFSLGWKASIGIGALEIRCCHPETMVVLAVHPTSDKTNSVCIGLVAWSAGYGSKSGRCLLYCRLVLTLKKPLGFSKRTSSNLPPESSRRKKLRLSQKSSARRKGRPDLWSSGLSRYVCPGQLLKCKHCHGPFYIYTCRAACFKRTGKGHKVNNLGSRPSCQSPMAY